jgi:glucose-6-phosphate dehydrogenase assembly protein OpcA
MSTHDSTPVSSPPSGQTPEQGDLRTRERQEGWAVPLDRVDAFTLGAPIAVEPDRIEAELAALWRKAAERAQSQGARFSVTRACLWNFIIHSDGEADFQHSKRLIDEVSESVPARIINIFESQEHGSELIGDDGSPLRATVEANFRRSGSGRREVLAEEITLEAPRLEGQRLPGLVRSLLLADVPTAILVRNPAADLHWLPRLAPEADRFIFDSGRLAGGAALDRVFTVLEGLYGGGPASPRERLGPGPRIEIVDLGWLRLWPWRILLGGLFDPPAATQALDVLDAIEIVHGPAAEPAALLLAGWLLSRLPLTLAGQAADGSWLLDTEGASGKRRLSLRISAMAASASQLVAGPVGIAQVVLRAGEQVLSGRGLADGRCISLASPFQPERLQPVHGRPDAELLVAAMGVGGRDPLMYEALRLGAQLVRAGS